MTLAHIILLLLLIIGFGPNLAQAIATSPTEDRYKINRWTSEDGLPANNITSLAQTPDGYIWAGTWFGLARFDGVHFRVFNRYNTPAMVSDAINALAVDRSGRLWIGTSNGLLVLDEKGFKRFSTDDGLPDQNVWELLPSRDGGLWVRAGSVVFWRDDDRPTVLQPRSLVEDRSWFVREEKDGTILFANGHGLYRGQKTGAIEKLAADFHNGHQGLMLGAFRDRQDHWWISDEKQLIRFSGASADVLQRRDDRWNGSHFIYQDTSGLVWVNRGRAGLWQYDQNSATPVTLVEPNDDQMFNCMMEDSGSQKWIGAGTGLYQLRSKNLRTYNSSLIPRSECWSATEGPDGAIWFETNEGLARIYQGQIERPNQPLHVPRRSILFDRGGALWMGDGGDGITVWKPNVATNYIWRYQQTTLDSLYLDRLGRVWAGTGRGVIWFTNCEPSGRFGDFNLPTNSIRAITQTRSGEMWFGTVGQGAIHWKCKGETQGATETFTTAQGLADNRVFVFYEDEESVLWIGTHNGLSRLKNGRFFNFRKEQGLFDNLVNWLEEDEQNRFWLSCNRGIFSVNRSELNEVADGKKTYVNASIYGTADGMLSPETNGEYQPAGYKARDGRLWFPTSQGIVVIDPGAIKDSEPLPVVVIEEARADGELIGGKELTYHRDQTKEVGPPRLPPGRGRILQFRFTGNSFDNPKRVRFQYRLTGRENEWRPETEERAAYYTDLRPGSYRFEVKAANAHGLWSEKIEPFSFEVTPTFTQTRWFPLTCAAGLLALATGFAVWRLRWQRALLALQHQRELANERARLARDLHDDFGTALTGLALELDVARNNVTEPATTSNRLQSTAQRTRELAERMREVVWAVNPKCDTVTSLANFLEQQAAQFFQADGLRGRFSFPEEIPPLPLDADVRHQLALALREALTNVVRHARAREVTVSLSFEAEDLIIRILDDGVGYDPSKANAGNGITNMRERLEQIGSTFTIQRKDPGTEVTFRVRLSPAGQQKGSQ